MTITTSSYTANSLKINIINETSSTNIIAAIQLGMTKGGWTLYDSLIGGTTSGHLYSPMTTLVYTAPNTDYSVGTAAATTKYFIIRIDIVKLVIYTSTCESWSLSTHAPTNETWSGGGIFPHGYDIKDSIILINATPRHCVLWTFIKNEPGFWSGVFEFERVAAEDTASAATPVPNWAWTNSLILGTPYGNAAALTTSTIMFAFPRTADGLTGARAASVYAPVTNRGMFPPNYPTGTIAITRDPNMLHLASYANNISFGNITYGWDTLKSVASPISADAIIKYMPLGRMYNAGITKSIGGALDTVFVNLDNTGGWPNAAGSSVESLILPLNGGCEHDSFLTGDATTTGTTRITTTLPVGTTATKVISVGNNLWIGTNFGIYTYDMGTGANGTTTLRVPHNVGGGVLDVVFDGARTVYGSLNNGIVAVDTETFTTSTISTISSGTAYLGIDGKYVYGVSRTALVLPWCFSIARSNFTLSSSFQTSSSTVVATSFGVPVPDYQGNVYLASQAGVSGATLCMPILSKFVADTGIGISISNPKYFSSWPSGIGTTPGDSPCSFWMDYTATSLTGGGWAPKPYLFVGGAAAWIYEFNTANLNTTSFVTWTYGATGIASYSTLGTTPGAYDLRGDLAIIPMRGQLVITSKKIGFQAGVVPTGYVARVIPNHPTAPVPGQSLYLSVLGTLISAAPWGVGLQSSNGTRIFGSWTPTVHTVNNIHIISGLYNVSQTSACFPSPGRLIVKG